MNVEHLPLGWECEKRAYAMGTGAWYRVRRPDRPDVDLVLMPQNYTSEVEWHEVWDRAEAGPDPDYTYLLLPRAARG